jgi:thioredoxin-dependent peroxiredoxin
MSADQSAQGSLFNGDFAMWTKRVISAAMVSLFVFGSAAWAAEQSMQKPPAIGEKAPDFKLNNLDGKPVALSELTKSGPTVLVVLRGYPGYQCPLCTKQFGELLGKAKAFADGKATLLFVYPGPASDLDKHAQEFIGSKSMPENFRFVIDPNYEFTNLYHLRWDAPNETAYPSTFVIDPSGVVRFAKVSNSHGGRASAGEMLEALKKMEN